MRRAVLAGLLAAAPMAAAQQADPPAAAPMVQAAPVPVHAHAPGMVLPANSEVVLRMNEDLTSKSAKVGQPFFLTVAQDVIHSNMVVIPRGTRGIGEVTWTTGKGAFGKSGKMEIELKALELGGRRIPVTGNYRQEGEGNTVATVATAVMVGVFSAFVTGKSALIPRGRELVAHTVDPLPFAAAPAAMPTAVAQPQ